MSALLAIGWQPELRGILITIIAIVTDRKSTRLNSSHRL